MSDLAASFHKLFADGLYSKIINLAEVNSITPSTDPLASKIVAASHFQLNNIEDAHSLLSELEASLSDQPDYLSLFAATCRRYGRLDQASELFERALLLEPDSREIKNNFANLLIDQRLYSRALALLDSIVDKHPQYQDAISNRARLKELIAKNSDHSKQEDHTVTQPLDLGDPLLLAFQQDEVDYSMSRYFPVEKSNTNTDFTNKLVPPSPNAVIHDQLRFAEASIKNGNPSSVFEICSKAIVEIGHHARTYEILSDAYLHINKVTQAEICLLHAVALDGKTPKRCFNLCSFSMIRKNYGLADYYLSQAALLDPSSELLDKYRRLLVKQKQDAISPFIFKSDWDVADTNRVSS